jgi:phosphatidylcholine synthase
MAGPSQAIMIDREPEPLQPPASTRARAFAVHLFTASGAALALLALFAAGGRQWAAMFAYLGVALVVDGIDGSIARRLKVAEQLPRWSGDVLDLVVDFTTYVFVPAYAIGAGGLLPEALAVPAGAAIVVTGALYFADRDMKTKDNYFRGFPALWNAAAFYLFVFRPAPWMAAAAVALLVTLTFAPFKFVHPFRVVRWRAVTIAVVIAWTGLATIAILRDLDPGPGVAGGLLVFGLYFLGVGLTDRATNHDRPSA